MEYTLVVVDPHRAYTTFAYGQGATLLGLLYYDHHFDALTSLPAFFGKCYFCGYNRQDHHLCRENTNPCCECFHLGCANHLRRMKRRTDALPPSSALIAIVGFTATNVSTTISDSP